MTLSDLVLTLPYRVTPDYIRVNLAPLVVNAFTPEEFDDPEFLVFEGSAFMPGGNYPGISGAVEGVGTIKFVSAGVEGHVGDYVFLALGFVGVLGMARQSCRTFCGLDLLGSLHGLSTVGVFVCAVEVARVRSPAVMVETHDQEGLVYELFMIAITERLDTVYFSVYVFEQDFVGELRWEFEDDRLRGEISSCAVGVFDGLDVCSCGTIGCMDETCGES